MEQSTIVFGITILMSVLFFTNCIPMIAAAFVVPILLQVTGVLTPAEAWSGFSNTTIISFVMVFAMSAVLKKSSFISDIQKYVHKMNQGTRGKAKVLAALGLSTCFLTAFMNAASATAVIAPIIISVAAKSGISQKKVLKMCGDISSNSFIVFPMGLTLSQYLTYNAYLDAAGANPIYRFHTLDQTFMKLPIFIVWLAIMILVYPKVIHVKEELIDTQTVTETNEKGTTLSPEKDRLAKILFFGCLASMIILVQFFKIPIYITCGLFTIASIGLKVISIQDAVDSMAWISIVLTACTLPLATAFKHSGASEIFGNALNAAIGGISNEYILVAIFFMVPAFLTQFMSNFACSAIFSPLAVAASVALRYDPRFLVAAANFGAFSGFLTPMSTACEAIVFGEGKFKMGEFALNGMFPMLVWFVLFVIWFPICSKLFFT